MRTNLRWCGAWLTVAIIGSLAACSGSGTSGLTPQTAAGDSHAGTLTRAKDFTTFLSINSGGGATGAFMADAGYNGGQTASTTAPIDTSGVTNPAPQAVYQTQRYGTFTYSGGAGANARFIIRLHFAELAYQTINARVFNVTINSAPVLTNFDIYAAAGARNKAVVETFPAQADASGKFTIAFTPVKGQPVVNGIEVIRENLLHGAPVNIAAGNGTAVGNFSPDNDYNSGQAAPDATHTVDTSGVTNPPPQGVYANQRMSSTRFSYLFSGLSPNTSYNLRLDFVETQYTGPGQRIFNVGVNNTPFLTNYDIFADAGSTYKATAKTDTVNADATGSINVVFTAVTNAAKVNALELSPASISTPPPFSSKIQHVVVVIQENRSFDNLFNGFPGADTAQSGINSKGQTIALVQRPLELQHDPAHNHTSFVTAYDNGKNDAFDLEGEDFFPTSTPNYQYAYVPPAETADYFTYGKQYGVGDRMFTSNSGPSYVSHQYLIAGQSDMVAEVPSALPWGCDAPPGTTTTVLNSQGQEEPGPFPCFNYETLADLMDAKGVTWAYYAPSIAQLGNGYIWSAYDAVQHIRFGPTWTHNVISPETTVLSDIQNNNLRQVSYVVPDLTNSDHALSGSDTGPAWVSAIIDAVGQSQYWQNTAILVMWDDWGGWYDHVVPPQLDVNGLGFRVPLMVISPYAKHGYVSHTQHEFGSVLKFIEETYNLGSLGQVDVRSDDLGDFFDLSQTPKALVKRRSDTAARSNIQRFMREIPSLKPPDND